MNSQKILVIVVAFVTINSFKLFLACDNFSDTFHFSPLDMRLKLEEAIHNDMGFSVNLARFFHNKVAFSINQIFINYLHFWDVKFGVIFFSIVGYCGIFFGFWYLIKTNSQYKWYVLAMLLLLPLIEVFRTPASYQMRLIFLAISFLFLSIFGVWQFVKNQKKKAVVLLILLVVLSLWYQMILQSDAFLNCFKK